MTTSSKTNKEDFDKKFPDLSNTEVWFWIEHALTQAHEAGREEGFKEGWLAKSGNKAHKSWEVEIVKYATKIYKASKLGKGEEE